MNFVNSCKFYETIIQLKLTYEDKPTFLYLETDLFNYWFTSSLRSIFGRSGIKTSLQNHHYTEKIEVTL